MNYPIEKYHYYTYRRADGAMVVKAVSTYAGKRVVGKAICHPHDSFNFETGKALAAARCNEKVASKRYNRANQKYAEAMRQVQQAQDHLKKMMAYLDDAKNEFDEAIAQSAMFQETL